MSAAAAAVGLPMQPGQGDETRHLSAQDHPLFWASGLRYLQREAHRLALNSSST